MLARSEGLADWPGNLTQEIYESAHVHLVGNAVTRACRSVPTELKRRSENERFPV